MSWRIGADIGGTFIDFCAYDTEANALHTLKVLTTPDDPGREVMEGIALLQQRSDLDPRAVTAFVHGTTIGINTVIQRKGAVLALLTTEGFEDVTELARLRMPDMHSLFCARPEQLVPRDRIFGVRGRILADGSEQTPLCEADVREAVARARARHVQGLIISFINAYRNPAHEQAAKALARQLAPELFVFTSTEIWPVVREYERTTTAILNGYVHPRVADYLTSLEQALRTRGIATAPMITRSNGGVMHVGLGKSACVHMLLSGTASGVMGAAFLAQQAGISHALTLDIGGTSADVALIAGGLPQFGMGEMIGDFPLYIPSVSVTSIGDGGGSIATIDDFGVMKVGPESAGSTPGPACYGNGGTQATITDAMVVCGFLGHAPLAYRTIELDRERAETAVGALAGRMELGLRQAAEAIVRIAISNMFVEVSKLIARHGVDPRDFTLMPFGGAGPMLGCLLARELGITRVMVPGRPGVVSALGGLVADVKSDFIRTLFIDLVPDEVPPLQAALAELQAEAEAWLRREHKFSGSAARQVSADMRYQGQSFEIEVQLEESWIAQADIAAIRAAFHRQHHALYDFADEAAAVRIVNLRLVTVGSTTRPELPRQPRVSGIATPERQVTVWYDGAEHWAPLYRRDQLLHGHTISGPAVVAQEDATICVPAGFAGEVDALGNLLLSWRI